MRVNAKGVRGVEVGRGSVMTRAGHGQVGTIVAVRVVITGANNRKGGSSNIKAKTKTVENVDHPAIAVIGARQQG